MRRFDGLAWCPEESSNCCSTGTIIAMSGLGKLGRPGWVDGRHRVTAYDDSAPLVHSAKNDARTRSIKCGDRSTQIEGLGAQHLYRMPAHRSSPSAPRREHFVRSMKLRRPERGAGTQFEVRH